MNTKKLVIAFSFAALVASPLSAAVITWGAVESTTGIAANDIAIVGDVLIAINGQSQLNSSSLRPGDVTLSGITFLSLDYDQFLGQQAISTTAALSLPLGTTTGDADYDTLLTHVAFVNVNNATNTAATGLSGTNQDTVYPIQNLTVGQQYSIQLWYTDQRPNNSGRTMTYGDNETGGNVATVPGVGTSGFGSFVVGSFTADSVSQDLRITTTATRGHVTGLLVQAFAVPEPSSFFLCGFSATTLLVRRKRT